MLTAAQAAARLGVKPATLYAYVSRGLLDRRRTPQGSRFEALAIEEFAARRTRRRPPDTVQAAGSPLMVLDTDVAVVLDDELFLRGRDVTRLATGSTLADVARWLWDMTDPWPRVDASDAADIRRAVSALPASASPLDRIRTAVTVLAATDPVRADTSTDQLRRAAARVLVHLPCALDAADPPTLWHALSARAPSAEDRRALEAALILVVDHDLAVSTMAARMAASARGSAYAIVGAALGAFESPLHGTASRAARALLEDVRSGADPADAIAAAVARTGRGVPGFGQRLYTGTDARAAALLPLVYALPGGADLRAAVAGLSEVLVRRVGLHPNVDLALAALTIAAEMPPDAGATIFAVGRTVGWIAHGLDEYAEPPLRLRPRGRYVGPMP
nr:citrate synthase [Microbacterium bovistercoris]